MNVYKNKKKLLLLMGLFSFSMQSIDASQYSKKIGMSLVAAAKVLATDRSAMQSAYPENDSHNHNIMNGTYFDKRPFIDKAQKRNFIEHHFKPMNVVTDMNEICVDMLTGSNYSRLQLVKFMNIAQQAAYDEKSDVVKLKHLERAYAEIEYGMSKDQCNNNLYKTAHHEAGHAVINSIYDTGKVIIWGSIQPSNDALGYVYHISTTNNFNDNQKIDRINMLLAGGITEQVFGIPEKFAFDTENNIIRDFHSRGTRTDFLKAIELVEQLALTQSQIYRNDCLLSESKARVQDLTVADDFIVLYENCTKMYLDKDSIHAKEKDIMKAQYLVTIQLVKDFQPEIAAVAQELLREKVVSGKKIKEIIHEVQLNNKK